MGPVLITYASRGGSTAQVAAALASTLRQAGFGLDLRPLEQVASPDSYSAVILGTAIRNEQWLPEALEFIERHAEWLRARPTAYFCVCLSLAENSPASYERAARFADLACRWVEPVSLGLFAGAYDPKRVSLPERLQMQFSGLPSGDFRDWDEVSRWAHDLASLLPHP